MIKEFQIRVTPDVAYQQSALTDYLVREKGVARPRLRHVAIIKRSIDARQRQVYVNLTVRLYIDEEPSDVTFEKIVYPDVSSAPAAIVVGAGPGGLFAALRLVELGFRPIVLERGKNVHDRKRDLAQISRTQTVDPESNYCFGEGGAGAYSDGKLYTRSKKRGSVERILRVFCQHGAPLSILADAHPHIGTDKLPGVIEAMRNTIMSAGGEVLFQTKMTHLVMQNGSVCGVIAGGREFLGPVILATGHSARDVYRYLHATGIQMEAKGIAVGVRLEHPSHLIDQIQYHSKDGRGRFLPAAEYGFVCQVDGRGVYSFCMCPGGFIIPAATDSQQLVVNGMSPSSRGGRWSNSGMVVEVRPEDIPAILSDNLSVQDNPLGMMHLQEKLEHLCWMEAGKTQRAPAQRMADFVRSANSTTLPQTSYAPGVTASSLHQWMPQHIARRLQQGFAVFGQRSRGFLTNEAMMIAIETRTSAPVRIVRDGITLQHINYPGLYPCGEGAGYAGGIVSAAIDGERCAEMLAEKYAEIARL